MNSTCPPASVGSAATGAPAAIEVRRLSKRFRPDAPPALDDLSITVPEGVIYGILGPNGAGKTTLLSILCGLLRPSAGSVCICGHDGPTPQVKRSLGVVPQEPAVYPTLTGRENLEYFGRMQGLRGARLAERVAACLQIAEIEDAADRRVEHYSGGYRRRLNLVIGLIHEPRILILDEPTVAIDPHSRSLIHQRLRELHASGVTIMLTTHYMEEAEQLCHRVAILHHGRVMIEGAVAELLARHRDDSIQITLDRDPPADLTRSLQLLPGVGELHLNGRCLVATAPQPMQALSSILQGLGAQGLQAVAIDYGQASLEHVFLHYTGEGARA
ncbi:MAG: ABC transporter ATP-binding protein [Thiobacillaceae bacterium]|nr:ABC transporter ATP-binding protein [Thiobacillaceae bacterium]